MFDARGRVLRDAAADAGDGSACGCLPEAAGPTPAQPSQEPTAGRVRRATSAGRGHLARARLRAGRAAALPLLAATGATGLRHGTRRARGTAVLTLRAEGDLDGDGVALALRAHRDASATGSWCSTTAARRPRPHRVSRRRSAAARYSVERQHLGHV